MKHARLIALGMLVATCFAIGQGPVPASTPPETPALSAVPRFQALDVFVDSGAKPLAAWQVHVHATGGSVKIVGVEGGEGVYANAPYYDLKAIQRERVVIGGLSTLSGEQLPTGKVRVARVHVMIEGNGDATFAAELETAGDGAAKRIDAKASVVVMERK